MEGAPTHSSDSDDALGVIELATVVLARNQEMLRRRSTVYAGIDRAEYLLLRVLDQRGPADICSLAAALGLDPSTAGRQVNVMESKGFVSRTPSATDRRRTIISPTEEGDRLMRDTLRRRRADAAELLHDWSQEDLRTLGEMFSRYNDSVAARYLDAARE